jgi:hypothetical protein
MSRRWMAIAALTLCVGCGDAGGGGDASGGGPREGYPAGPYGTNEGAIVADLAFALPDGTRLALSDVYADGANRLLLLSTASGWCASCVEEQRDLQRLHERYRSRGLFVLVALFEDADFRAADTAYAESWVRQFGVTFAVAADEGFALGGFYDRALTPMVLLVDVPTMKILRKSTGWDASAFGAILEARL